MSKFLFRKGDGNEGNFPRFVVELGERDCPYAALKALVANEYIAGRSVRRHIVRNIEVDGEAEYGIHATVHEGPRGETAFGAAWLTPSLCLPTMTMSAKAMRSESYLIPLHSGSTGPR